MRHICKMKKHKIREVIKYFSKKGMPPKEIQEDFMETLGKKTPSHNTVKKWAAEFKRGRESVEDVGQSGQTVPNMPPLMNMSRSCTPWLYVFYEPIPAKHS